MGCETNLPPMVITYLELIGRLSQTMNDVDSSFPESKLMIDEIAYYFQLIRQEMRDLVKSESTASS